MKCPSCGSDVIIKSKRDNKGLYASCQGYPDCRECIWFPDPVKQAEVLDEKCSVETYLHLMIVVFHPVTTIVQISIEDSLQQVQVQQE
ncbi:hypothetical protein Avbf_08731 [Armadillidium vulgare]|nr:hypothetical protein Avbf_08731 [Armadillidium vulgare]